MKHIMIDIETMGNSSGSAVVSIGGVQFDLASGQTGKEFYVKVSLQSCLDIGLNMDASTVIWWLGQSDEARRELTSKEDVVDIKTALEMLDEYINECGKDSEIWGNSARFDLGILSDAYKALGMNIPWSFRKERCVRTLVALCPLAKENHEWFGTGHHAVSDCHNQIQYCSVAYNNLVIQIFPLSREETTVVELESESSAEAFKEVREYLQHNDVTTNMKGYLNNINTTEKETFEKGIDFYIQSAKSALGK